MGGKQLLYPLGNVSWYVKLQDFSVYKALAMDNACANSVGDVPHFKGSQATFNILFKDGHVSPAHDTIVVPALVGRPVADELGRLDDYVDILETEALGKNPRATNADPATTPVSLSSPLVNRINNWHPTVYWP